MVSASLSSAAVESPVLIESRVVLVTFVGAVAVPLFQTQK